MKTIALGMALVFIGCGSSDTITNEGNVTNNYYEANKTIEIPEVVISPYGNGSMNNPYIVKENGLYTAEGDTYFLTNILDVNCSLVVKDFTNDIYNIVVYDTEYTVVSDINNTGTYVLPVLDTYNIQIESYLEVPVGIASDCLN